jgi:hypothetical protein
VVAWLIAAAGELLEGRIRLLMESPLVPKERVLEGSSARAILESAADACKRPGTSRPLAAITSTSCQRKDKLTLTRPGGQ